MQVESRNDSIKGNFRTVFTYLCVCLLSKKEIFLSWGIILAKKDYLYQAFFKLHAGKEEWKYASVTKQRLKNNRKNLLNLFQTKTLVIILDLSYRVSDEILIHYRKMVTKWWIQTSPLSVKSHFYDETTVMVKHKCSGCTSNF